MYRILIYDRSQQGWQPTARSFADFVVAQAAARSQNGIVLGPLGSKYLR